LKALFSHPERPKPMTDLRGQLQSTLGLAYTLERELGGGGMSRVFVARDMSLERLVVVKVLSPELAAGVSADRFTRETKLAASLQQANIVPVLSAGATAEGLPYYTMPFVDGQSLRSRLAQSGVPSIGEVIGIIRDVAKALAYAHERGIVHRDIKPDNVLLSGGTAVVTDFGIAKALTAARTEAAGATLTQLGTSIGTPAYMSPEQAAGDPEVDHRADIYSLGCLAYELLTGQPPFHGRTPQRMLAAHMAEAPKHVSELRPETPQALAELVMRCLSKDPPTRPQTVEIGQVLESVTSGGGIPTLPSILIGGPGMLKKALGLYAAAFVVVAILAQAAIMAIGLPEWVLPGALVVMALGLPVILFTAYVHRVNRQIATLTPAYTPGGTPSLTHSTMATLALKATPHVSWRRTAIGGTVALGAFVLLTGGFMTLRALGIGPAGSLLAAGKITSKEPLLVTDFKVTNADSSLGRVLGDATKATLSQSSVINLATPEAVANALRRMERPPTSTLHFPLARELALRNNIKAIVDGEVTGLGPAGFIVTLKLVTTDSVRELASFRESASDARGLIEAVDKLSRSLRGRVGESLRSVRATLPFYDATTSSLDALRKYTEGSRIAELETNYDKAIPLLREAVTIDSTFAAGWRKLGIVMSNAGRPRISIDSAMANAYRYRDRLTESERDYVIAAYYNNGPGRDRGKAAAAYESMLRRGDTSGPANNLALLLIQRREYVRAETLYRAQERACPGCFRPLYGNLATTLRRLEKLDAADSVYREGLKRFPDQVVWKRAMLDNHRLSGDTAAHRRVVDSMNTKGDSADKVWARARLQQLALQEGRLRDWRRLFTSTRPDSALRTPRQRLNIAINPFETFVDATMLGNTRDVERRLDAALAGFNLKTLPEIERPYFDIARTYAWARRPDKARAFLDQFEAEVKDTAYKRDQSPARASTLGEILLAEQKPRDAVMQFKNGDRRPDGPHNACSICTSGALAAAFDAAGDADSAITHYERAIVPYSWDRMNNDQFWLAPFSKRLGELHEQRGDQQKAAKFYRDFVNLWKNADPELQPQVAEVRRKLARMANVEGPRQR
jgi:tetratricopeptide (TPR) repeat protein/tRNA A-37 threonylcarbamoyl transferase component Bud32